MQDAVESTNVNLKREVLVVPVQNHGSALYTLVSRSFMSLSDIIIKLLTVFPLKEQGDPL